MTNTELGSVDVTKTVQGATDWAFDFTICTVPTARRPTATQTATDEDPDRQLERPRPGVEYTITESSRSPASSTAPSSAVTAAPTTRSHPRPGEIVDCTVTNIELASVDVTKTVAGHQRDWAFDFTISPDPDGEGGQPPPRPPPTTTRP